jgi:hypothetical protein
VILVFILVTSLFVILCAIGVQIATDIVQEHLAARQPKGRQQWVKSQGRHRFTH